MTKFLMTLSLAVCFYGVSYGQSADAGKGDTKAPVRGISISNPGATVEILKACLNQPQFKKYYDANSGGTVNIVGLPAGTELDSKATALGRNIRIASFSDVDAGSVSNYLSLGNVSESDEQLTVSLTYFYNHTAEGYKVVMVDVEMIQKEGVYQIVNANFKGDTL